MGVGSADARIVFRDRSGQNSFERALAEREPWQSVCQMGPPTGRVPALRGHGRRPRAGPAPNTNTRKPRTAPPRQSPRIPRFPASRLAIGARLSSALACLVASLPCCLVALLPGRLPRALRRAVYPPRRVASSRPAGSLFHAPRSLSLPRAVCPLRRVASSKFPSFPSRAAKCATVSFTPPKNLRLLRLLTTAPLTTGAQPHQPALRSCAPTIGHNAGEPLCPPRPRPSV